MQAFIKFLLVLSVLSVASSARLAGECAMMCNDLRTEVLTLSMCRDAKRTLPRPKVGDFCSTAMEQGFSDACVALCMNEKPVGRVSQTCRAAAIEMPRPTVRKWCEHGYNVAFKKTIDDLYQHFAQDIPDPVLEEVYNPPVPEVAHHEEITDAEPVPPVHRHVEEESTTTTTHRESESSLRGAKKTVAQEDHEETRKIQATIPITLEDVTNDLIVYEGQNAEEAVVIFCREHVPTDVSTCIRQLLTVVIEKLEEASSI